MKLPTVRNTLNDLRRGVTYHVLSYRELSREELIFSVRLFNAKNGRKKLKKGTEIEIISTIGG